MFTNLNDVIMFYSSFTKYTVNKVNYVKFDCAVMKYMPAGLWYDAIRIQKLTWYIYIIFTCLYAD